MNENPKPTVLGMNARDGRRHGKHKLYKKNFFSSIFSSSTRFSGRISVPIFCGVAVNFSLKKIRAE